MSAFWNGLRPRYIPCIFLGSFNWESQSGHSDHEVVQPVSANSGPSLVRAYDSKMLEADIPTGLLNSHSQPKGGKFTNACEILK